MSASEMTEVSQGSKGKGKRGKGAVDSPPAVMEGKGKGGGKESANPNGRSSSQDLRSAAKPGNQQGSVVGNPFRVGKTVQLSHGRVNYRLEGPPAPARLVVFLHGLQSSLIAFEHLLPLFWEHGFQTLVYDHYGHGLSSSPCCSPLNHVTFARQLEELLDAVVPNAGKIGLIGFSMGGLIASEFARDHLEKVSHLCLLAPAGLLDKNETPCRCFLFQCLRGPAGCCIVRLVNCLMNVLLYCLCWTCCIKRRVMNNPSAREWVSPDVGTPQNFKAVSQGNLQRFAARPARSATTHLRILSSMPMWGDEEAIYEDLAKAGVPILFMWGDCDGVISLHEVYPELLRIFEPVGASCIVFPNTGHHFFLEYPRDIAQNAIHLFLDSQDPAWQQVLDQCRLRSRTTQQQGSTIGQPSSV